MPVDLELAACNPEPVAGKAFNSDAVMPHGLTIDHMAKAMKEFVEFLGFVNTQLNGQGIARLESMLMPANFSSIVGEFMISTIPKHSKGLAKNQYHNGHPDLIPTGKFPDDSIQHTTVGIEIKASRYQSGWQGHNPENVWLMVFVFDSNRPVDLTNEADPRPFRFVKVVGAGLKKVDWAYAGRSATSRRTITASVRPSGRDKMESNWIYKSPSP